MKATLIHKEDIQQHVERLHQLISEQPQNKAAVVGLYGDLGAGKTTFVQHVGEEFGVTEKIASPTFVIEKIYKISNPRFEHLIHIDAYRIENPNELLALGWNDIIRDPGNIVCVEWADRIASLLPRDHIKVHLDHAEEDTRHITIG